ncbi:MAG TPA: pyruvate kinase alpha/beta domain-containing protein, partial [Candidatus Limnocylindrales bacterium]|nr:pyruvate kinase alpha/beta domain-containing protein [Candidatus Limnocylindrales bacterium]
TAVILGADCVMLSEETANGKYPIHAVEVLKRIIMYTQSNMPLAVKYYEVDTLPPTRQRAICEAVINLADNVSAKAIVAETKSGAVALQIIALRPNRPLIAVTSDSRVAQQLAIVYGTKSYVRPDDKLQAVKLTNWLRQNNVLNKGDMIVSATGQHPGVVGTTDTIKVRVLE